MINVTKTFLPPQEEYNNILKKAWELGWITNRGVLVKTLETELKRYLDVPNIIAMTNGTLPLQIAIKALKLKGEIITTPFSYIATTSSVLWEGCKPVFVDIDPDYLTIDELKIEAAITPKTSAILATHVYGNPCNVGYIEKIAEKYGLKVIYDAAHCFGVKYKGKSIFLSGDVSTCSFHATKIFHSGEGGAIFCKEKYYKTIYLHHNFGHDGPDQFDGLGINAKMSELQAAMGLAVLPYIEHIISERRDIISRYNSELDFNMIKALKIREGTEWNYSYYPIIISDELHLNKLIQNLNSIHVFPRRYFFPSLNKLPIVDYQFCPVSEDIANKILCLPLYVGLDNKGISKIISIINNSL